MKFHINEFSKILFILVSNKSVTLSKLFLMLNQNEINISGCFEIKALG